ncbi:MAG: hypothetical protein LV479_09045 [Methylacidiphilales bacterium]|nr:hypothetical protein [Candidatus Methylacidiphilales bacterium]
MPSRAEITNRLGEIQREGQLIAGGAIDTIRRGYLKELADYTGRNTVIYAASQLPIIPDDIRGFMTAFHELQGDKLDLIIHSGGGSSEATEQIVQYARKKFAHIRALIPERAMSAATMLACACDEIVMGKQSAIGPIDPQFTINGASVPAYAILEDFNRAIADVKTDPKTAALWVPKLNKIPHGLISLCEQTIARSEELVKKWLMDYGKKSEAQATEIAHWLASYVHKSHGKPIDAIQAREKGLNIVLLEEDQQLQDKLLSVFHSTVLTFETNPCLKLTENHLGKGYYLVQQQQLQLIPQHPFQPQMPFPLPLPFPQPPPDTPQVPPPSPQPDLPGT